MSEPPPEAQNSMSRPRVVLVTGPAGAGRSTAINALEDAAFEAIDNMPLSLVPRLLSAPDAGHAMALGLDARNRDFSVENLIELVDAYRGDPRLSVELLFLDCRSDVLVRRYSETRRRHPLSPDGSPASGVALEEDLLRPVRERADILVDTSDYTPHDLRAEIMRLFNPRTGRTLSVSVQSFSYKRGLPRGADLVFDVRFLQNPHWDAALRALDGRHADVAAYIASDPRFDAFFDQVLSMVTFLLPAYREEGKSHLAIAFGCTGGRHRSVATAQKLTKTLASGGWQVSTRHRELERASGSGPRRNGDGA